MSGICGFVGTPNPDALVEMRDRLWHRGPDAGGVFTSNVVSLAHRRLSILDLSGGHQPMASADGSTVVVFNGEIYNHPKLQQQLSTDGATYGTRSDTETILHAYARWGTDCVRFLDGMFAFVLYDRRRDVLFGARDRIGKKPLYYSRRLSSDLEFAFASEPKSLLKHPDLAGRAPVSIPGLISYLLNDYVLGQQSIYADIERLAPGSAFELRGSRSGKRIFRTWKYWHINVGSTQPESETSEGYAEAKQRIIQMMIDAVESRLMSDVPVGVFLSGGIDSSTIVSALHRLGQTPIKTFSIGFREQSYDETRFAQAVADEFHTEHYSREFGSSELVDWILSVSSMLDEPFADPAILPTCMLSEFAAEHVKVVLSGDGADELFAGYDPFKALAPARWYRKLIPSAVHSALIKPLSRLIPESDRNISLAFKVSRFLRGVGASAEMQVGDWMGPFTSKGIQRLVPDIGKATIAEAIDARRSLSRTTSEGLDLDIDQALDFYQRYYLPDDILVKTDRASMIHSLEIRAPFLDTQLVEYVNSIPAGLKLHRGRTKHILKEALVEHGMLSQQLVDRKKKGFGIPVARWMRVEQREFFEAALFDDWPSTLNMISSDEVRRLWNRHVSRRANHYKELWSLVMLRQWAQNWFENPAADDSPQSTRQNHQTLRDAA